MWWILPWLLFLGCMSAVAVTYLFWVRRPGDARPADTELLHDLQDFR